MLGGRHRRRTHHPWRHLCLSTVIHPCRWPPEARHRPPVGVRSPHPSETLAASAPRARPNGGKSTRYRPCLTAGVPDAMAPSMRRSTHARPRRLGASRFPVALLLVALLIRGLIPSGWMPNTQGVLHAPLVICTSSGTELRALETPANPGKPQSAQHHDVCAFAGHLTAPVPPSDGVSIRVAFVGATAHRHVSAVGSVAIARHREQAARAPPISV
jgi:hypothetical protein